MNNFDFYTLIDAADAEFKLLNQIYDLVNNHCLCCNAKLDKDIKNILDYNYFQCTCFNFSCNIATDGHNHTIKIFINNIKFNFRIAKSTLSGDNYALIKCNDTQLALLYFDDYNESFNYFKDFPNLYNKYKKFAVIA